MSRIYGCDISHYTGKVDWHAAAKAGVQFCYAKASEGLHTHDSTYLDNRKDALRTGIALGSYHVVRAKGEPHDQVQWLLNAADGGPRPGEMPLCIDFEEDSAPGKASWVLDLLSILQAELGYMPVIYTGYYTWQDIGLQDHMVADCPLWLAAYDHAAGWGTFGGETHDHRVPKPWTTYAIHQYAGNVKVPWAKGNVDFNVWNGSEYAFALFKVKQ